MSDLPDLIDTEDVHETLKNRDLSDSNLSGTNKMLDNKVADEISTNKVAEISTNKVADEISSNKLVKLSEILHDSDLENSDSEAEYSEDEEEESKCIFNCTIVCTRYNYREHLKTHDFDYENMKQSYKLSFYDTIILFNFIRYLSTEHSDKEISSRILLELQLLASNASSVFNDNSTYLKPTIENDLFLTWIDDGDDDSMDDEIEEKKDNHQLNTMDALTSQVEYLKSMLQRLTSETNKSRSRSHSPSRSSSSKDDIINKTDTNYFASYTSTNIHKEMLLDYPRTNTYKLALELLSKYKIVMDVGSGSGVLSMFAAKAGAIKVHGIEMAGIYKTAEKIIKTNGLSDKITFHNGKMEELNLKFLDKKVDLIVSEWMGYILVFESMLSSVIYARDRYLKPDGQILPSKSKLFITGLDWNAYNDYNRNLNVTSNCKLIKEVDFFNNCYDLNMSELLNVEVDYKNALVEFLSTDCICSTQDCVLDIDIMKIKDSELDFTSNFEIKMTKDNLFTGFCFYFDCSFTDSLILDTSPNAPYTHWKQTILLLDKNRRLSLLKDDILIGRLTMKRPKEHPRGYDIVVEYKFKGIEEVAMFQMH